VRWLALVAGLGACNGPSQSTVDAPSADGEPLADALRFDGVTPLTWVDFTVSGCTAYDPAGPSCTGTPPLSLRFAAVAPSQVDRYLWELGEGGASTDPTPEHTYTTPGAYDVTLSAGGPGGTARATKEMFVRVEPAPVGSPCSGAVCADGLECVCGGDPTCPASLRGGLCARGCATPDVCGAGAVCADLSPAPGPADPTGWRRNLCLKPCEDDGDCAPYRCRELRAGAGGGWVRGCFVADLLFDDGASCRGASGLLEPERCASGRCLALGSRGLCAADCGACAANAACATWSGGGTACLARCDAAACDGDPWLGCEAPDPAGTHGFSVAEVPDPAGYCAPKRCDLADDCAGGSCPDGFCGPP
jgi:hypothetical protein